MTPTTCRECGKPLAPTDTRTCSACGSLQPGQGIALALQWLGGLWTLLGAVNLTGACFRTDDQSEMGLAFSLLFNALVFLFPGLVVFGIGTLLAKRS